MIRLRWIYLVDGILLLICGFLLGGWSNSILGMDLLGISSPGDYMTHLPEWRAVSFAGELGGALTAFGFATLAIFHTRNERVYRSSIPYFLAGHLFLSFIVWAKQMAFGASPWGLWILAIALYPCAAFLYALFNGLSSAWMNVRHFSEYGAEIRDAAAQQERNRLAQDLHDSVKHQARATEPHTTGRLCRKTRDSEPRRLVE